MSVLPSVPLVVAMATVVLTLALGARPTAQRLVSVLGTAALVVVGIVFVWRTVHGGTIFVGRLGGWPPPFGVVFVVDVLAALMILVTAVIALVCVLYSLGSDDEATSHRSFHPLVHVLLMGVNGAYLTGDLFDLYVWFEVSLIASFVLLALGGGRASLEGALKYVVLHLFGSVVFLTTVGVVYAFTGTLNMAQLSLLLPSVPPGIRLAIGLLLFTAFGLKAAVFPLFFWLPASYHTAPAPLVALFSGLLTKVGVVAMVRLTTLLLPGFVTTTGPLVGLIAALTMLGGVLGAFAQSGIRRILSFHIISQIGFLVLALAVATPLAFAGLVFYMIHNVLAKADLFLVGGIIQHRAGGDDQLAGAGDEWRRAPLLGLLFLVPALSLAGVPPLSGFWAKLFVVKGSLDVGGYLLAAAAIVTGLLTLLSMLKIWNEAFWKQRDPVPALVPTPAVHWGMVAVLGVLIVFIGLAPAALFGISEAAAVQLADPGAYIDAVLGVEP